MSDPGAGGFSDIEFLTGLPTKNRDLRKQRVSQVLRNVRPDLQQILRAAIQRNASDIHIEPFAMKLGIRFRVDGILVPVMETDAGYTKPLTAQIKVMSSMDIGEQRLPQDGSTSTTIDGSKVDLRVSIVPVTHGEKTVIRILQKAETLTDLKLTGMLPEQVAVFSKALRKLRGLILVTGPTGSGKSTTLYAALNTLSNDRINISTLEDPVEYQIPGVNQSRIRPEIGFGFARSLKSLLRQDPDVIMVGEIRDGETADIAVRASLTGHLVLSTLHTTDAASAIIRLIDMGVKPFLLSAALSLVVAQRLVRLKCPDCGPTDKWCAVCRGTGVRGRTAVCEILEITDCVRSQLTSDVTLKKIQDAAVRQSMQSMYEVCERLVADDRVARSELDRIA